MPTVEQVYYEVDRRYKIELLTRLIDIHDLKLGIIFCNTKRMVDDLVDHLNAQGYSADRLHGDMSQAMRDRVMNKFRKSGLEFLVATDVAARGIDVDDVQVVFNYDLPYDPEDYLHRIGRTGRAGRSGRAISFVAGRELFQIYHIERYTKVKMHHGRPPPAGQVEAARCNVFLDKLRATLQSGEFKRQDHLLGRLLEEGFTSTDISSALLHQLQGAENAPAKPPREEERPRSERPERPPRRERDERDERPPERRLPMTPRPMIPSSSAVRPPAAARPAIPARPPAAETAPRATPAQREAPWKNRDVRPAKAITESRTPKPAAKPAEQPSPEKAPAVARTDSVSLSSPPSPQVPAPVAVSKPPAAGAAARFAALAAPGTAARKAPFPPGFPVERRKFADPSPTRSPKASRRTPDEQTRLHVNVGEDLGVVPIDVVNTIAGETGLPGNVVGTVDIRGKHLFADVAAEHANAIISKLNRAQLKNRKLKVKLA